MSPEPALAALGGAPAFSEPLHVGRPNLPDRARLYARLDGVFDRAWLTNDGPLVAEFEAAVAERAGVDHCVATGNATAALGLLARALDLTGEVVISAFTFVATAHAMLWQGASPVFADIDPRTHNLDSATVEAAIGERTVAILGTHVWGRPCAVEELTEIAELHDVILLFDAAHAFGCAHGGRPIGSFGRAEVFSFHATKLVNSFEGGAIVTGDDALAERLRLLRNFGFADFDDVVALGTNAKMSEASAAMGLTSLEAIDEYVVANRVNHEAYAAGFADIPGIDLVSPREVSGTQQYAVVEVSSDATLTRDEVQRVLWAENVLARRYFHPGVHRMEPYRSREPARSLPATEAVASRVLVLPTGTAVTPDAAQRVAAIVRTACEHAGELRARTSW